MLIDIFGWIGTFLLSICGFPQLYITITKKTVKGLSLSMCITCGMGCIFALIYIIGTSTSPILIANYLINGVLYFVLTFLYFKYKNNN